MNTEHEIHIHIIVDETSYRMTCAICRMQIISVNTVNADEIKKAAELAGKLATRHYCVVKPASIDADRPERTQ